MILLVARRDLVGLTRDRRLALAVAILWVLVALAAQLGLERQARDRRLEEKASAAMRRQWLEQGEKNPHSAAHYGVYAFWPPPALSAFDPGVVPHSGRMVYLEAHHQNLLGDRAADDAGVADRLGVLTPAGVLAVLAPLLIIGLAFSSVAGERERGTLALALALGVSPRQWLLGKGLGLACTLGLLLVPPLLATLLVAGGGLSPWRVGALVLGYGLYFAGWLGLALAGSVWATTSRGALVGLIAFWVFSVLAIPRIVAEVEAMFEPLPTAAQVAIDLRNQKGGAEAYRARVEALERELFERHGVSRREDLPVNFDGLEMQLDEEISDAAHDRIIGALHEGNVERSQRRAALGFVVPLLALRTLSQAAAGTDAAHLRAFVQAAEAYRRAFVKKLNDDLAHSSKSGDWGYKADHELWASVPAFSFAAPPDEQALAPTRSALFALAGWAGLALLLLAGGSRRLHR